MTAKKMNLDEINLDGLSLDELAEFVFGDKLVVKAAAPAETPKDKFGKRLAKEERYVKEGKIEEMSSWFKKEGDHWCCIVTYGPAQIWKGKSGADVDPADTLRKVRLIFERGLLDERIAEAGKNFKRG